MKPLLLSLLYTAAIGILINPVARLWPRRFNLESFPFAALPFERQGKFYERLGIRKWKNRVPDMSKILPYLTPKRVFSNVTVSELEILVQETCVAELAHGILFLLSLLILLFWRSAGSALFLLLYNLLGNLPYIMIQRYNRPRLLRLIASMNKDKKRK